MSQTPFGLLFKELNLHSSPCSSPSYMFGFNGLIALSSNLFALALLRGPAHTRLLSQQRVDIWNGFLSNCMKTANLALTPPITGWGKGLEGPVLLGLNPLISVS